jgi:coenzyme PQQ precursor peptide PqqA
MALRIVEVTADLRGEISTNTCNKRPTVLRLWRARELRQITWEIQMTWKTPKIVEVQVGMEINMYACAVRE